MCFAAAGLLGAMVSSAGSLMSGQAQANAANGQASLYAQRAADERAAAGYNADRQRDKALSLESRQRASFLSNGVSPGSGSPLSTIVNTASETELDVAAIRWNGELRARNYDVMAQNERSKAESAQQGSFLGALSPVIKVAGNFRGGGSDEGYGEGYGGTTLDGG